MRNGAAHEGNLAGAGDAEIGDVLSLATQETVVFQAENGGAYPGC